MEHTGNSMRIQKAILYSVAISCVLIIILLGKLVTQSGASPSTFIDASSNQDASAPASCTLDGSYPDTILRWCKSIIEHATYNNIDPNLVAAIILIESRGLPQAYSNSGAVGLMQVMPRDGLAESFQCQNGPCFADRPTMMELFNPDYNISYGTELLSDMYFQTNSLREALKRYGPANIGYTYADEVLQIYRSKH